MVALADWLITPTFLQLEKLSSHLLLLAALLAAIFRHVSVITCLTSIYMELPCPMVRERILMTSRVHAVVWDIAWYSSFSTRQQLAQNS